MMLVAPNAPSVALSESCRQAQPGVIETEVVVVGTGAGAAVAGTELAKAGKRVVFLEAGGAYSARDFQHKKLSWSTSHLYAFRSADVSLGPPAMIIPSGAVVGGSTVLNSGICFRPTDERLREWARLAEAEHLLPEAMAPFVDEIWRRLGIGATHAGIGRRNNLLLQRGLERIGAAHNWMDRNAPGCLGCGVCHMGCPSGAKASVDKAILPEAVNHGATIFTRARVNELVIEGGRAKGVVALVLDPDTEEPRGTLTVKADVVIVGGNAMGSAALLEHNGIGGPERGKHLAVHGGIGVLAEFDEPVVMWDGVPQGYYGHDPESGGIIESANIGPAELYGLFGRAGEPADAKRFAHLGLAGTMIRDDGLGYVSVDNDELRRTVKVIFSDADVERFKKGTRAVVRAWFAAGARRVAPMLAEFKFYESEGACLSAIDAVRAMTDFLQPHASHPQGTCRMGPKEGPNRGVVDGNGKVHGVDALYVMDGSIFPSTLGVNPQVTIQALALNLSRRLLA